MFVVREKGSNRVDQKVLKRFGQLDRMSEERGTYGVDDSELEGRRVVCWLWMV